MRVMVIIKANAESEAGQMPSEQLFTEMGAYNEELVNAGIMLAGEGLQPSSSGKRIRWAADGSTSVVDGPFAETKELIAGYWLWQVDSMDQAVEWARRIPNPDRTPGEVELRPIGELEDLGETFTPELREQEERIRQRLARQQ